MTTPTGQTGTGETGTGQITPGNTTPDTSTTQTTTPAVPDNLVDKRGLQALYRTTGGRSWSNNLNWMSSRPIGEWAGVTAEGGRVIHLSLGSNNLAGEIPGALGRLTRLQSANLRGNDLTGCIPYNTRLRNALSQSNSSGRGASVAPGWDLIILHAINEALISYNSVEAVRSPENIRDTFGFREFLEATYGLGLADCPPPAPSSGIVSYGGQSAATDQATLLAIRKHFIQNGTPRAEFKSWQGDMTGFGLLRRGWRGVELNSEGRLVKLGLDERQLKGGIPPQLGSLGQLVELNLSKNFLTVHIPPELGHLRNLRLLALNQNFTPKSSGAQGATDGLSGVLAPALGNLGELRRLVLDDNPFLTGNLPLELGNLTNLEYIYIQDTGFSGCLPPPIRQNFSPTLGSLLNELVKGLTIDRVRLLMSDEIGKVARARGFAEDVDEIVEYNDESFNLYMLYAPLDPALSEVSRAITIISLDTIIKPGSTLSNLGNVRLTC